MGIFSRTRDIIHANVNDLLDRAEDPAKTIRLVIMEMEETLVEVRASAARAIADQKEMRRSVVKLGQVQDGWAEKAELALSKDREDLAKAALLEKQKAAQSAQALNEEIAHLDRHLAKQAEDIGALERKLADARARQNGIMARLETANNRAKLRQLTRGSRTEEAMARFEIMERRVDFAEGRVEAFDLSPQRRSLDEEIADLHAADAVDAELASMKARRAAAGGQG